MKTYHGQIYIAGQRAAREQLVSYIQMNKLLESNIFVPHITSGDADDVPATAVAVFLAYDVTQQNVEQDLMQIMKFDTPIKALLAVNSHCSKRRAISIQQLATLKQELDGFWLETSTKTGQLMNQLKTIFEYQINIVIRLAGCAYSIFRTTKETFQDKLVLQYHIVQVGVDTGSIFFREEDNLQDTFESPIQMQSNVMYTQNKLLNPLRMGYAIENPDQIM